MNAITQGLGDCGTDPCGWTDWVWVSDSCLSYLQCADPSDSRVVAMNKGLVAGVTNTAANMAGSVLTSVGTNAGAATGNTLAALLGGLFVNADGTPNFVTIGVAAVVGFALLKGR